MRTLTSPPAIQKTNIRSGKPRTARVPGRLRLTKELSCAFRVREAAKFGSPVAAAFTLIEVLVVLVILALLAGIVTTQLLAPAEDAKASATRVQVKSLMSALDLYRLHNSNYPTTEQGLAALIRKPEVGVIPETWRGPYINSNVLPVDGWKRQFIYTSDGRSYQITSLGADGVEGGTGLNADIRSAEM
jgi:general secretion pathway protein G